MWDPEFGRNSVSIYGNEICSSEEFVHIDDELHTEIDVIELNAIANDCTNNIEDSALDVSAEEDDGNPVQLAPPTLSEATAALDIVKDYFKHTGINKTYDLVEKINFKMMSSISIRKKTKQPTLDLFFKFWIQYVKYVHT